MMNVARKQSQYMPSSVVQEQTAHDRISSKKAKSKSSPSTSSRKLTQHYTNGGDQFQ